MATPRASPGSLSPLMPAGMPAAHGCVPPWDGAGSPPTPAASFHPPRPRQRTWRCGPGGWPTPTRWTLDLGPSQATRPPEALAPGPSDLQGVVAAVHHACHTLTQIAAADQDQIRTAAGAGRLLVPTRSLPDKFDIPHPFAHAPSDRVDQVLADYRDAGTASTRATAAVGEVATAVRAPSQVLTAARAAV